RPVELVNARRETRSLDYLRGKPVAAFCGLGNPAGFRQTLIDLGARLEDFRTYPDHHHYTHSDVDDLRSWATKQAADGIMVTTQKDLVKLRLLGLDSLWAVRIRLQVESASEMLKGKLAALV